jgi:RNA polymerase subunit RPABC4/transcription elongation factor Spt4
METKKCRKCKVHMSSRSRICPTCGCAKQSKPVAAIWLVLLVTLLATYVFLENANAL